MAAKLVKIPSNTLKNLKDGKILIPLVHSAARQFLHELSQDEQEEALQRERDYQSRKAAKFFHSDSRLKHLHPSSICGCSLRQIFKFLRAPREKGGPPEDDWKSLCRLQMGSDFHLMIQTILKHKGTLVESEAMFRYSPLWMEGSCDGILEINGQQWVAEFKSMASRPFTYLTEPKEDHVEQTNLYMHAFNIPRAIILYWDKSTHDLKEFAIQKDPLILRKLRERAEQIVFSVENAQLIDPPHSPRKAPCSYCEFWQMCWGPDSPKKRTFKDRLIPGQYKVEEISEDEKTDDIKRVEGEKKPRYSVIRKGKKKQSLRKR